MPEEGTSQEICQLGNIFGGQQQGDDEDEEDRLFPF